MKRNKNCLTNKTASGTVRMSRKKRDTGLASWCLQADNRPQSGFFTPIVWAMSVSMASQVLAGCVEQLRLRRFL